jgi:hypothetical protein
MNKLLYGMMNRAALIPAAGQEPANVDLQDEVAKNFRPNRAQRRAMVKMRNERRWDKKLARHYNIPRALVGNAKRYGSSVEMLLSDHLQHGAIKYKEMPEDGNTSV